MTKPAAVSATEGKSLFADLEQSSGLVLAVSGGPDSTALMWLVSRWRKAAKIKPKLLAVTVDHGLRKESKREAAAVAKLARKLGVAHRIVKWSGSKPKAGIQQGARQARYRLLVEAAKKAGAAHVLTAHTLDDQAETVIMRMARGSGIGGLGAMARRSRLDGLILVRPFLDVPKARLIATLKAAKIAYAEDPSNIDPKFTRARLRPLMPQLAREGLDARRLSVLARRLRRADAALEAEVDRAMAALPVNVGDEGPLTMPAAGFARLSNEIALRLLGRAITRRGDEGPVELGKLEAMLAAVLPEAQSAKNGQFRRTLAGALVSVGNGQIAVETAPARQQKPKPKPKLKAKPGALLTKPRRSPTSARKAR